jgi:hypothetical protein
VIRVLRWVALLAVLVVSATFEYSAGVAVGLGWAAPAVPVMVDAYAVSAMLAGRDVRAALALLWTSVTTGALHRALTVPGARLDDAAWVSGQVAMAVLIATVATGVLWRVDELFRQDREAREQAARAEAAAAAQRAQADDARRRYEEDRALQLERARTELDIARTRAHADTARDVQPARTRPARPLRAGGDRARSDDLERRRALRAEWEAGGRTMTAAEVAARLGIEENAGRAQLSRWNRTAAGG